MIILLHKTKNVVMNNESFLQLNKHRYYPQQQKLKDSKGQEVTIRPQSLEVLHLLAKNLGETVSKDEIFTTVWQGISVTDDSLVQCISDIRRALGDSQRTILKTVPRRGYSLDISPPLFIQMPGDLLPFYGRNEELTELHSMLTDPSCRLLALVGMGGMGKSRLAKILGKQLATEFSGGSCFVELASIQQAELIPQTIANALGTSIQGTRKPLEQLVRILQQQELLLILDNIEHLLPDVQFCQLLLESCAGLKILLTSREPPQIYGEWIYPLQGLSISASNEPNEDLAAYSLFVQSARRNNPHYHPTSQDKPTILNICQLVSGMPLGIEIAATWAQHLSCPEILEELKQSLLANQSANAQGTVNGSSLCQVLQQSWDRLNQREQKIMQTLALFRGTFTHTAASSVAGIELDDYCGLINKSMISRNATGDYSLHEVMRQYAGERGFANNHYDQLTNSFIDFHLEIAKTADADILGGQQLSKIVQLESNHSNLRECLNLCSPVPDRHKTARPEQGLKMVGLLGTFWFLSNHWKEGQRWAESFLAFDSCATPSLIRANALLAAGGLSVLLDDYAIAERHLNIGTDMAASFGSSVMQARGLTATAVLRRLQGRHQESIKCGQKSMQLFESIDDEGGYQFNLGNLGHSLSDVGRYDEAVSALEECIELNQRIGPTISLPYALVNLGRLYWKRQQADVAKAYLLQAIHIADKLGILLYRAQAVCTLGWIAMTEGNATEAQAHFTASANDYLVLGDREGLVDVMKGMTVAKTALGELPEATQFMVVAEAQIKDWPVPLSSDNNALFLSSKQRLERDLNATEQTLYRNLGLAMSPEALFVISE